MQREKSIRNIEAKIRQKEEDCGKFDISFKYPTCFTCGPSVSDSSGTTVKRFLVKPSSCRRT